MPGLHDSHHPPVNGHPQEGTLSSHPSSWLPWASLALGLIAFPTEVMASNPCDSANPPDYCFEDPDPGGGTTGEFPRGNFEEVIRWPGGIRVSGWSFDPDFPTSANTVSFRAGTTSLSPIAVANLYRPDVGAAFPSAGNYHGYVQVLPLGHGTFNICAWAANYDLLVYDTNIGPCRSITVSQDPFGWVDAVERRPGGLRVRGWVIDPDSAQSTSVSVFAGSTFVGTLQANQSRPDVSDAYPGYGDLHGFDGVVSVNPGTYDLCFDANKAGGGLWPARIHCRSVTVGTGDPKGNFEAMQYLGQTVKVSGWALDPDVADSISVDILIDGVRVQTLTANLTRTDVGDSNPGYGNEHGFEGYVPSNATKGTHTVCAKALNVGAGADKQLNCMSYTVYGRPSAPSSIQFYNQTDVSQSIAWIDTANDETGFHIQKVVDGIWQPLADYGMVTTGGMVNDSGLTPSTRYCYRVQAYNDYGTSDWTEGCGTTLLSPVAAPTSLLWVTAGQYLIALRWMDNATDEDGYSIALRNTATNQTTYPWVAGTATTGELDYMATGLTPNTTYCMKVLAKKAGHADAPSNEVCATTMGATAIPSFAATPGSVHLCDPRSVTLSWTVENTSRIVLKRGTTVLLDGPPEWINSQGSYQDTLSTDRTVSYTLEAYDSAVPAQMKSSKTVTVYEYSNYETLSKINLSNNSYYSAQAGYYDLYGNLLEDLGTIAPGTYKTITLPNCQVKRLRAYDTRGTWVYEWMGMGYSAYPVRNTAF